MRALADIIMDISIHALRMEGDVKREHLTNAVTDFYPRPPDGGRRIGHFDRLAIGEFLSTPSGWRATFFSFRKTAPRVISIHALRMEGDVRKE